MFKFEILDGAKHPVGKFGYIKNSGIKYCNKDNAIKIMQ